MSDLVSRQNAIDALEKNKSDWNFDYNVPIDKDISTLVSLPSATCDDCIWHVCNYNKIDWDGDDGYISKRDAIALVDRPIVPTGDAVYDNAREDERESIKDNLLSLPSAEQKTKCIAQIKIDRDDIENFINKKVNEIVGNLKSPKTGEWVEIENGEYLCNNCSHITIGYPPSYCPNCGSYNGGDEE